MFLLSVTAWLSACLYVCQVFTTLEWLIAALSNQLVLLFFIYFIFQTTVCCTAMQIFIFLGRLGVGGCHSILIIRFL